MFSCYFSFSLVVKHVCVDKGTNIPNTFEKSTKNESVTEWYTCAKYGAMKCKVLVLPQNRSCGILWTTGYEIRWYKCTYSEGLKLPAKFIFSKFADCSPAALLNLNIC